MADLVKDINSKLINSSELLIQYRNIKLQNEGYIVFFRVGEFYETYFDDAFCVSENCSIVLTRKCFKFGNIAMAGVPAKSRDNYIKILLDKGFKVALCEEFSEETSAGIRMRKVVRKYTAGILFDEELLNSDENNFLCAVCYSAQKAELAFCDVSTNQIYVTELSQDKVFDEILKFKPSEILISENCKPSKELSSLISNLMQDTSVTFVGENYFKECEDNSFSLENSSLGAILNYLKNNSDVSLLDTCVVSYKAGNHLNLSYGALRNLEVLQNMQNFKKEGTLFWVLDVTKTPMGRRLLEHSLKFPLLSKTDILRRQNIISYFIHHSEQKEAISSLLSAILDISRTIVRIKNNYFKNRDFIALKNSISSICSLVEKFNSIDIFNFSDVEISLLHGVKTFLDNNISDDIQNPLNPASNPEFQLCEKRINDILTNINLYEKKLRAQTRIKNLKISLSRYNKFIIEIPRSEAKNTPQSFMQYQVLSNQVRYTTNVLENFSKDYALNAANKHAIANSLVLDIASYLAQYSSLILRFSDKIALFDMLFAFSQIAVEQRYVCPKFSDGDLLLNSAKHPALSLKSSDFQPTSFEFSENLPNFILLTGANMAGKSTLMRQIALISIMAQVGSFVPAESALLPIFDKIFVRFGTLDNIYKNKSSFALEMYDVKQVLENATKNSLILLDELGKSTSTQDGSAIARAVSEYIFNFIGAKTILATHYHNLKNMCDENSSKVRPIAIMTDGEKRIVENGFLDKSHGIKIAQDLNLPDYVLERAIKYASLNR